MTGEIAGIVVRLRELLNRADNGILAGAIPEPANNCPKLIAEHWVVYTDFLFVANGGRFGVVDLWGTDEIDLYQYPKGDLPGAPDRWLIIGKILYEILAMETDTGFVFCFNREDPRDFWALGHFDEFLLQYIFGPRYLRDLTGYHEDEWWRFLCASGRVPPS